MKSIKMALLGGAALAVTAAAAQADDLDALKAQIEALNARVAAMEATPSVPAGYSLLTIAEVDRVSTPGLDLTSREDFNYGKKSTIISVLPTADAPAGANIVWSGYARAALVYRNYDVSADYETWNTAEDFWQSEDVGDNSRDDWDVLARGQLRVQANTDTAVGEVGVDIRLRADYDGVSGAGEDVYADVAWGYWAMTPELTFGGGFAGSLANIGYGQDGATISSYTQTVAFNPGDTSQLRLSYGSGPFTMAVAVEDASTGLGTFFNDGIGNPVNYDALGVAGEVKYSGDMFSGEISGVFRQGAPGFDDVYAVGVGGAVNLDMITVSAGAQMGQYNTGVDFWRASILASANLSDEIHAEVAYGHTENDGATADVDAVLAGIYYDPVSQLTIGLEGEWFDDGVQHTQVDLVTVFRF